MLNLERYGIAAQWPRLAKLQAEVGDLERRRREAEGRVQAARQAIPAARDKDAEAAGRAIRAGRTVPEPKHEAKAKSQLEDAERVVLAYQRALEGAQADLAQYMAQHSAEIRASVMEALRETARRLREHAAGAAVEYALIEDSRYDLRNLAPPPQAVEPSGPARNTTTVIGRANTQSAAPARGNVEEMFRYLCSLEGQFAEPVEGDRQGAA